MIDKILEFLVGKATLKDFVQVLVMSLGGIAILILILIGLFAFAPTIISIIRKVKGLKFIILANIFCPILFVINSSLPQILWLILMIFSFTLKKQHNTREIPNLIVHTHVNNKYTGRKSKWKTL